MKATLIKNDTIADYGSIRLVSPTTATVVDIAPKLKDFYATIGCECVEFADRKIAGHPFLIVCDEEALLKDGFVITDRSKSDENLNLVGNVLVFNSDENGEPTALTDADIALIKSNFNNDFLTID